MTGRAAVVALLLLVSSMLAAPPAALASERTATSAASGPKTTIKIGDNYFKPKKAEITAGTTVVWKNVGNVLHSVKPNSGKLFGSSGVRRDKAYKYTFQDPGTYQYYCPIHSSPNGKQSGTIVVKEAPTPTTTVPAPTTTTLGR